LFGALLQFVLCFFILIIFGIWASLALCSVIVHVHIWNYNQTGNIGYTRRRQSKQNTTQHNILHEKDCTVRNITKKPWSRGLKWWNLLIFGIWASLALCSVIVHVHIWNSGIPSAFRRAVYNHFINLNFTTGDMHGVSFTTNHGELKSSLRT
jgi:hypothetical protein